MTCTGIGRTCTISVCRCQPKKTFVELWEEAGAAIETFAQANASLVSCGGSMDEQMGQIEAHETMRRAIDAAIQLALKNAITQVRDAAD